MQPGLTLVKEVITIFYRTLPFLIMKTTALLTLLGIGLGLSSCGKAPLQDTYPLTTCIVSGEDLNSMGRPYVFTHEGREIRLCCNSCREDFDKDPEKYLSKLKP
jgi:YHS domain-containing protein